MIGHELLSWIDKKRKIPKYSENHQILHGNGLIFELTN